MKRLLSFVIICLLLFSFAYADEVDNFMIHYNVYAENLIGGKQLSEEMLSPSDKGYLFKLGNNTMVYLSKDASGNLEAFAVYAENMDDLISCSMAGILAFAEKSSSGYVDLAGTLLTMLFSVRTGADVSDSSAYGDLLFDVSLRGDGWFMTAMKH